MIPLVRIPGIEAVAKKRTPVGYGLLKAVGISICLWLVVAVLIGYLIYAVSHG
jgi:hypothetical protein